MPSSKWTDSDTSHAGKIAAHVLASERLSWGSLAGVAFSQLSAGEGQIGKSKREVLG